VGGNISTSEDKNLKGIPVIGSDEDIINECLRLRVLGVLRIY
jgi:hypothetical protein